MGEELYRIATALEKIADSRPVKNEATIVAGMHNFYGNEVEQILDATMNDFELRRALRNLVKRAKDLGGGE